jgi:hypothetical protein
VQARKTGKEIKTPEIKNAEVLYLLRTKLIYLKSENHQTGGYWI